MKIKPLIEFKLSEEWIPKSREIVPIENFWFGEYMLSIGGKMYLVHRRKNMKYPKLISIIL